MSHQIAQTILSQGFLLAEPFGLRKITTDPHILAHVNTECSDVKYSILTI